jgi:hypothetical protein
VYCLEGDRNLVVWSGSIDLYDGLLDRRLPYTGIQSVARASTSIDCKSICFMQGIWIVVGKIRISNICCPRVQPCRDWDVVVNMVHKIVPNGSVDLKWIRVHCSPNFIAFSAVLKREES